AGRPALIDHKRSSHIAVEVDGHQVWLRDQAPLHRGNVHLHGEWTFDDLVNSLNARAFFWPGTADRPISYGLRHFERYRREPCAILVLPTDATFAANRTREPLFCRYNSGSPRCTAGRPSPRGPATFVPAADFKGVPSQVVEVTYLQGVKLPASGVRVTDVRDWVS